MNLMIVHRNGSSEPMRLRSSPGLPVAQNATPCTDGPALSQSHQKDTNKAPEVAAKLPLREGSQETAEPWVVATQH